LSKHAIERDEEKRKNFYAYMMENFQPEQLVFVDESAVDKRITSRNRGWAESGRRAVLKTDFVRGQK
jgi:hypothetical protein